MRSYKSHYDYWMTVCCCYLTLSVNETSRVITVLLPVHNNQFCFYVCLSFYYHSLELSERVTEQLGESDRWNDMQQRPTSQNQTRVAGVRTNVYVEHEASWWCSVNTSLLPSCTEAHSGSHFECFRDELGRDGERPFLPLWALRLVISRGA